MIEAARAAVPRDRTLIAGTGRESTRATIAATRRAAGIGADAVLVRTPSFFKGRMTPDAFVAHYTAVADASPVPVLLYNFLAVTGVNLAPETVARLAEHPNIAGMKESGSEMAADRRPARQRAGGLLDHRRVGAVVLRRALHGGARRHPCAGLRARRNSASQLFEAAIAGRHAEARELPEAPDAARAAR